MSVAKTVRVKSAATTNATSVTAKPTQLSSYQFYNGAAYAVFVKFYDKASAPTVGTDTPKFTVGIPATSQRTYDGEHAVMFQLGLAYAITKAVADSDTTAVAADDVHGFLQHI